MEKVAFIDVDGTLTKNQSSWELAHHYFSKENPKILEEMKINSNLFFENKISYFEWAEKDVALWKGQPYEKLQKALLPANLIDGAKEGIDLLKSNGYAVYLISGGIDILVKEVQQLVGADASFSNVIGHSNGKIDGSVEIFVNDKSQVVEKILNENGFIRSKTVCVGDSVNDIEMFKVVRKYGGKAIAFNPIKPNVQNAADEFIVSNNFLDAIKLISS